jgi:hypothetical protein
LRNGKSASVRATEVLVVAILALAPATWADTLRPGSDAEPCENMLDPGPMQRCRAPRPMMPAPTVATPTQNKPVAAPSRPASAEEQLSHEPLVIGGVSETDIDAYLAAYGKPPREAVRALLNPTDENILAMHHAQQRQLVTGVYVAERAAALQQAAMRNTSTRELYTVLPHFLGMQLTLYVAPRCEACTHAVASLKQVLDTFPHARARLRVLAQRDDEVIAALQAWQVPIAAQRLTLAQAATLALFQLPTLDIVDTRSSRRQRLLGDFTLQKVRETVLALREVKLTATPVP